ncbi:MAG: hypothetical protein QXJ19_04325 [Candidatus Bathyarchaeia archaeon]|nr:hypothetical protein [Candidatus Bathyarchaeota archaeon]
MELKEVIFNMGDAYRSIALTVKVKEGSAEIKQVFINDVRVHEWQTDKKVIFRGEESRIILRYAWVMRETYVIKIVTTDDQVVEFRVKAPEEKTFIFMKVNNVSVIEDRNSLRVRVGFSAEGKGVDSFQALLFTYLSFNQTSKIIYVFFDERYMLNESLKRARAIIDLLVSYNFSVVKVNYSLLEELARNKPECILIVVNPLKDFSGRKVENVLPAPLIDPDGDGLIRDDSKYGKSLLYDWMREGGLILVTVGSVEPYKRIIYKDGSYRYAKDSFNLLDAHIMLTDANGIESILGGSMFIGDYSPTRITGTLGLNYRESKMAFNKNSLENYGLNYYGYGDYKITAENIVLNLTLPVFIRVGRGGWLSLGDEEDWLKPEEIAHDILMLMVHAVWDSDWIPYGWYWDSGTTYYRSGGIINVNGTVETELIPKNLMKDKIVIRLVGLAFSEDLKIGMRIEEIVEYSIVT